MHCAANSDDCLDVPKHAVVMVLPTDVRMQMKWILMSLTLLPLFKWKNYLVHICATITSNIPRPAASLFSTAARPNLDDMLLLPFKWRSPICPIQNNASKSAMSSPVNFLAKLVLFVEQVNLHVRVHFGVLNSLIAPLYNY